MYWSDRRAIYPDQIGGMKNMMLKDETTVFFFFIFSFFFGGVSCLKALEIGVEMVGMVWCGMAQQSKAL